MFELPLFIKENKKHYIKPALIVCFLLWLVFGRVDVISYKVKENKKTKGLVVTGVVTSYTEIDISSSVVGIIDQMFFLDGDHVKKGDVLFTLIPTEAQGLVVEAEGNLEAKRANLSDLETEPRKQEVQIAEAKIQEARSDVSVLQSELEETQIKLKDAISKEAKYTLLFKEGAISEREYEESTFKRAEMQKQIESLKNQISSAKAELEAQIAQFELTKIKIKGEQLQVAKAEVQSKEGLLQKAEGHLDKHIIRSPIDGYIVDAPKRPGDVSTHLSKVLKMVDLNNIYMLLTVDEKNLHDLKENQKVAMVFDAYPEKLIDGYIKTVIKNVAKDSGTFFVEVKFKEPVSEKILPGMKGDATVFIEEYKNKIIIPLKFVFYEQNKMYVFKKFGPFAYKQEIKAKLFDQNKMYVQQGLSKRDIIFKPNKKTFSIFRFKSTKLLRG